MVGDLDLFIGSRVTFRLSIPRVTFQTKFGAKLVWLLKTSLKTMFFLENVVFARFEKFQDIISGVASAVRVNCHIQFWLLLLACYCIAVV